MACHLQIGCPLPSLRFFSIIKKVYPFVAADALAGKATDEAAIAITTTNVTDTRAAQVAARMWACPVPRGGWIGWPDILEYKR